MSKKGRAGYAVVDGGESRLLRDRWGEWRRVIEGCLRTGAYMGAMISIRSVHGTMYD